MIKVYEILTLRHDWWLTWLSRLLTLHQYAISTPKPYIAPHIQSCDPKLMWTNLKWCGPDTISPSSCNVIMPSLLSTTDPSVVVSFWTPSLSPREKKNCIPDAKWTSQTWGNMHRRGGESPRCRWNGKGFFRKDSTASPGSGGTSSDAPAQVFWQFSLYLAVIQTQRIDVKFHNQLHFKSYMHIPGHDETLLCEGPDMIPVHVGSYAFYLQWFHIFAEGDSKFRTVHLPFLNPLPRGNAKPLDVKYCFKKMEWQHQLISF